MRRISISEARTHFYEWVRWVERTGRPVIIQRRGKDMGALAPLEHPARSAPDVNGGPDEA